MSYRMKFTELNIEISVDSPAELAAAFDALRPLMSTVPAIPALRSTSTKRTPPKRANGETSARGQRLVPKWLGIFRMLAASPNGIPAQEVSHQLGMVKMNGIGRATVPIRRVLTEHGLPSWDEVIIKARTDDGVFWRAGPKIDEAIKIAEEANRPG